MAYIRRGPATSLSVMKPRPKNAHQPERTPMAPNSACNASGRFSTLHPPQTCRDQMILSAIFQSLPTSKTMAYIRRGPATSLSVMKPRPKKCTPTRTHSNGPKQTLQCLRSLLNSPSLANMPRPNDIEAQFSNHFQPQKSWLIYAEALQHHCLS